MVAGCQEEVAGLKAQQRQSMAKQMELDELSLQRLKEQQVNEQVEIQQLLGHVQYLFNCIMGTRMKRDMAMAPCSRWQQQPHALRASLGVYS